MHSVACSGSSIKNLLVVSIKISLYTPRMSLSFIGFSIISRLLQYSVFKVRLVPICANKSRTAISIYRVALIVTVFSVTSGDGEIRTLDPLLARQVLSQLSYAPMNLATTCSPIPSPV